MSFTIDGHEWDYPCSIDRTAEVTASEVSGLMLDKSYLNDVIGTYMRYEVTIAFPIVVGRTADNTRADYYTVWRALTDPVDSHEFQMPQDDGDITVTARVESVRDTYVRLPQGRERWQGISFSVVSVAPSWTYTLDEMIARGLTPLPDVGSASEGDMYTLIDGEWVYTEFTNADNVSY